MKLLFRAVLGLACLGAPAVARSQTAENVAVIINDSAPESQRVGEHYIQQRHIPASNVIRIRITPDDTIDRAAYVRAIEEPIATALSRARLQDRVLYLVLTKGVPLRIAGTAGQDGTGASVDSELTLLYRRMTGQTVFTRGRVDNPYYLGVRDIREAQPFTHRDRDIFLVSRLDAFTVDEAIALVDRAKAPSTDGKIVLDQRGGLTNQRGDEWLAEASKRLSVNGAGERVVLEGTAQPVRDVSAVLGYYSWGSIDPQHRFRQFGLRFLPGAIAATFVSDDARTLREPPSVWVPGGSTDRKTWFAGSPHSLIGDLIREGVTGVAGHVAEPYLQSVVRPEILFAAYLSGHNLVESFYLALPHLSWQAVIIGDPLCAPFPRKGADQPDLDPKVDPATELPAFFSARVTQLIASSAQGLPPGAVTLWVRAKAAVARGDGATAQLALEQSIELAPRSVGLRGELALLHEQNKAHEASIEQYCRILELQPTNVLALNNLAYSLAVHRHVPAEGLPLAKRAATLAPTNPNILDTLAWIEHLLGDHATAAKRLAEAIRRDPSHSEIRLHAAIVYAAMGVRADAERELKEALSLNPALADTEEVQKLRERLAALPPPSIGRS